jgi:hypothetical protein
MRKNSFSLHFLWSQYQFSLSIVVTFATFDSVPYCDLVFSTSTLFSIAIHLSKPCDSLKNPSTSTLPVLHSNQYHPRPISRLLKDLWKFLCVVITQIAHLAPQQLSSSAATSQSHSALVIDFCFSALHTSQTPASISPPDSGFNQITSLTNRLGSDVHIIPSNTSMTTEELALSFFNNWYCENGLLL